MDRIFIRLFIALTFAIGSSSAIAQWQYKSSKDRMSGEVTKVATLVSKNRAKASNDTTRLHLMVGQTMPVGSPIYSAALAVTSGLFWCPRICRIQWKFDDENPYSVDAQTDGAGNYNVLFLEDADRLLESLKVAKVALVRVRFYGDNEEVFEFRPAGLKAPMP